MAILATIKYKLEVLRLKMAKYDMLKTIVCSRAFQILSIKHS